MHDPQDGEFYVKPLSEAALSALRGVVSAAQLSTGKAERMAYSRDMWPRARLMLRDGCSQPAPPACVIWPESAQQISDVVKIAAVHRIPLVPWGAGSGLCGGAMALQGGITLDLKRLDAIGPIASLDHLATVGAGAIGQVFEERLNSHGLTLGHFPASITHSTIGGWLATRSAGLASSRYGKIEKMVHSLDVVLADGRIIHCSKTDDPELFALIIGSEGTLGIIVAATLKVQALAAWRAFRGYEFADFDAGIAGVRDMMQVGIRPALVQLHDANDRLLIDSPVMPPSSSSRASAANKLRSAVEAAERFGASLPAQWMRRGILTPRRANRLLRLFSRQHSATSTLSCVFEGDERVARSEMIAAHRLLCRAGARDIGEDLGTAWYSQRRDRAYHQSAFFSAGLCVDTMEVAATWERIHALRESVVAVLSAYAVVGTYLAHASPEGASLSFTFLCAAEDELAARTLYDLIWQRGISTAMEMGAAFSHHHGVGCAKGKFMADEHGEGLALLAEAKNVLDPLGLLNPGKLGL